jgi:transcriptional regulator with XRE-family HTH domain
MKRQDFANKIGKRIAQVRKGRGVSQSDLSIICGKDRQSLHRVEKGQRVPSSFYLFELAQALDVSPSTFFEF